MSSPGHPPLQPHLLKKVPLSLSTMETCVPPGKWLQKGSQSFGVHPEAGGKGSETWMSRFGSSGRRPGPSLPWKEWLETQQTLPSSSHGSVTLVQSLLLCGKEPVVSKTWSTPIARILAPNSRRLTFGQILNGPWCSSIVREWPQDVCLRSESWQSNYWKPNWRLHEK